MDKCEECGKPMKAGDKVRFVDGDPIRYWHAECFDRGLTPIDELFHRALRRTGKTIHEPKPKQK